MGRRSTDRDTYAYDILKTALNEARVLAPEHAKCKSELMALERDDKTGKADHPVHSSKDVSDALASVVAGLTDSRYAWAQHKVNPSSRVAGRVEEKEGKLVSVEDRTGMGFLARRKAEAERALL